MMKGFVGEIKFFWARYWNKTCCRRSSCETSPSCRKCLHSSGVSITVLKAPVIAGCNCCHVLDWLSPFCEDVKRIGWQVEIVQARWNDWELPSESVWHCWFVGVLIES